MLKMNQCCEPEKLLKKKIKEKIIIEFVETKFQNFYEDVTKTVEKLH